MSGTYSSTLVESRGTVATPTDIDRRAVVLGCSSAGSGLSSRFVRGAEAVAAVGYGDAVDTLCHVIEQPTTHRGIQLKGRATAVRDATPSEEAEVAAFVGRTLAEYAMIGLAPAVIARMVFTPCKAVEFTFTHVFEQTPGPGAGRAVTVRR